MTAPAIGGREQNMAMLARWFGTYTEMVPAVMRNTKTQAPAPPRRRIVRRGGNYESVNNVHLEHGGMDWKLTPKEETMMEPKPVTAPLVKLARKVIAMKNQVFGSVKASLIWAPLTVLPFQIKRFT